MLILNGRGVAQSGSAFGLGPKGRRFKSSRPDQQYQSFSSPLGHIFTSSVGTSDNQTLTFRILTQRL
jgi:hypothetical protein